MGAHILDGRLRADFLKADLKQQIQGLSNRYGGRVPGLAVVRVGDNPASAVYVAAKRRQCLDVGIQSIEHTFGAGHTETDVLSVIHRLNHDPAIHGILLQLPLPPGFCADRLVAAIAPHKDVDGLTPTSMGRLMAGSPSFVPCTPKGCLDLLKSYQPSLGGLHAVILGRSILVGRPMGLLLLAEDMTVTTLHSKSVRLPDHTRTADVLIAAMGRPRMITGDLIKKGAIVLDVGITRVQDGVGNVTLLGDVDFDSALPIAGAITPVPGGIGPMTVLSLLQNTVTAFVNQVATMPRDGGSAACPA